MSKRHSSNKNKQWSGAASQRLLEMAGNPSTVEGAARIVVEKLLDNVPCPPTNLEVLAEKLRVTEICAEDLPVSGELRPDGKNFKVVYSNFLSPARRQFTIAHELGHAIFENSGARPPRTGEELERLCDLLASEILMPQNVFLSSVEGTPSIYQLLKALQTFKTSLISTSINYAKVKKVSIFYLKENKIDWGCGFVKKGPINLLEYSLQLAVKSAMNDEPILDNVFLNSQNSRGEWKLEHKPYKDGTEALFMLRPAQNPSFV